MKNLYDAAKDFANSQTGADHPAYADAMAAYYEWAKSNGVVDLSDYAKTADLGTAASADVAANVATGSTVDDVISALVASGLMASS